MQRTLWALAALASVMLAAPVAADVAVSGQSSGDLDCDPASGVAVQVPVNARLCVVQDDPSWGTYVVLRADCVVLPDGTDTCCALGPCQSEHRAGIWGL
jgi:hypothetical protein